MCWLRRQRTAFPYHTDLSHRDLTLADGPFVPAVFGHEGTGVEHRHLRHRIGWVERTDGSEAPDLLDVDVTGEEGLLLLIEDHLAVRAAGMTSRSASAGVRARARNSRRRNPRVRPIMQTPTARRTSGPASQRHAGS